MMNLNNVILVPGCMLCPSFQAVRSEKNLKWAQSIVPFLEEKGIGIVSMPCPEVSFGGMVNGMKRGPHGVNYYENLEGFVEHCDVLGEAVVRQINELSEAGFHIAAIVGIEHSPTCAASYMYTNQGTVKRKGLFIKVVSDGIGQLGMDIPIIGINRNYPGKFLREIESVLENM